MHFLRGERSSVVLEEERLEHMEERLCAIEGGGNYAIEGAYAKDEKLRDLAAQVTPPMMEREMITMIVDTFLVFYYEKMVGYMPSSFANLVFVGERIDVGLRRGKFDYAATASSSNKSLGMSGGNKKEGETHVATTVPTWPNFPLPPLNPIYQYQSFPLLTTLPTKNAQSSIKATPESAIKSICCTSKTKHHP